MKTKIITLLVSIAGLAVSPALMAQGCCAGGAIKGGCSMGAGGTSGGHEGHNTGNQVATAAQSAAAKANLPQSIQPVFDNYIKAQTALSQDSIQGFQEATRTMTKSLLNNSQGAVPPKIVQGAVALGKAQDLIAARTAFKGMSEALIQYLKDNKVPEGTYHEAYCPMAKASWLQTDKILSNPYMGKEMQRCGQFKS